MMTPRPTLRRRGRPRPGRLPALLFLTLAALASCGGEPRRHDHQPPPMQPLPPRVEPQSQGPGASPQGRFAVHLLPYRGHERSPVEKGAKGMWILNQPRGGAPRLYGQVRPTPPGA